MRKEVIRQTDFSNNDLPKTRRAQFFDIFRHQFLSMFKLSMLQFVFSLPLLACAFFFHLLIEAVTPESSFSIVFWFSLIAILCIGIAYLGLSGVFYVNHKLVIGSGVLEAGNFFIGIKENGIKAMMFGLFEGISFFIAFVGTVALLYFDVKDAWIVGLGIALCVIQFVVVSIMSMYSLSQLVTYDTPLGHVIKNSFLFTLMRFPYNLLMVICTTGILTFALLFHPISLYIVVALDFVFSSTIYLMWMLLTTSGFDKFVNKETYPDFYRKGLRKE